MKLVFANNYFYIRGGTERLCFNEVDLLKRKGHEVAFFARHNRYNLATQYSSYFPSYHEHDNISFQRKFLLLFKYIYSKESKLKFASLLDKFRPDIVHMHNIYGRLTTSIIDSAKNMNIPAIMTLHDYKLICPSCLMLSNGKACDKCIKHKFYNCIKQRCYKDSLSASFLLTIESYFNSILRKYDWIRYFIAPSMFLVKKYIEATIPANKVIHIPNFVDVDSFEPNYDHQNYVLFVGRLSHEKGLYTLLKAAKRTRNCIRIVGEGPLIAELKNFAVANSINNVVFEGYQSGQKLKSLFQNAAILVFPSEWHENAPMTILEAYAYGKPVIGSNIGAIPELIVNEETGLLFTPGNYHELADKIDYLLNTPSLLARLGKNARNSVINKYSPDIHYHALMKIYEMASK